MTCCEGVLQCCDCVVKGCGFVMTGCEFVVGVYVCVIQGRYLL